MRVLNENKEAVHRNNCVFFLNYLSYENLYIRKNFNFILRVCEMTANIHSDKNIRCLKTVLQ
jgi:hypothetical protein